MQTEAIKEEAISLFDSLSASKMRTVIQFARFIAQQPDDGADSVKAARDRRDIAWINANAERLNAEVEETLEFQADIWEDEENAARKCSLRGRFASCADPALRAQEKDAWSRAAAEKALSELEGMTFSPKAQTSMDGRAERAQALWRKYESLP